MPNVKVVVKEEKPDIIHKDDKKKKLCTCGEYVSVTNYSTHLRRPIHLKRIADQTARIKEIDNMNFSAEVRKMLIEKIMVKNE